MKHRLFLNLILLMISISALPQGVYLSGTVTYLNSGQPAENHEVIIQTDSTSGGGYYQTVFTNPDGFYQNQIPVNPSTPGMIHVSTSDCNGTMLTQYLPYGPGITSITADFQICQDSIFPDCQSAYFYTTDSLGTGVQFTDISMGNPVAWSWDFGDGNVSSLQNPYHLYSQAGLYFVNLTIQTANGCTSTSGQYLSIGSGSGCQAFFSWFPIDTLSPNAPLAIQFQDLSSGNPQYWTWSFGDGQGSGDQNPLHIYNEPGQYMVCLTIQSSDSSCYDQICMPVWIGNPSNCIANFSYFPLDSNNFNPPVTLQFMDQSFGQPVSWFWSFGDGTSSQLQNPVHTYSTSGIYEVCLTIQGSDSSCYDTFCQQVMAGNPIPDCEAFFIYYPLDTLAQSNEIQFVDQSFGNPAQWQWYFGDGSYSTEQNPIHLYSEAGIYNVCLIIGNPNTLCFDSLCIEVWVNGTGSNCESTFAADVNGFEVSFSGYLLNGDTAQYAWDFGDGNTATGNPVAHTYSGSGNYPVVLTTTTASGCTYTSTQIVYITDTLNLQTIQGQIFAGNTWPEEGMVLLMPLTGIWNWGAWIAPIDSAGHYIFTGVQPGSYHLLAIPYSVNGDTMAYFPTYYGDVIFWDQATMISLGTALPEYDIHLVACLGLFSGQGSIQGNITATGLKSGMSDVNILILDEQDQPLAFDLSNSEGKFRFGSLGYGTYTIWAEMHGVNTTPVTISLNENAPAHTVNLKLSGNSVTGLKENKLTKFSLSDVFPNPVVGMASLEVASSEPTRIFLSLYSSEGSLLLHESHLINGRQLMDLKTDILTPGMYYLRISDSDGHSVQRKLIKAGK